MRILMPERIVDRHVGGNTTYARHIEAGLLAHGIETGRMPAGSNAPLTMLRETLSGLERGRRGDLLHYVADTGPLLKTRRPSVVTVHGVASRWIDSARTPQQERIWRARVQRAIDSTDHVITVSASSAQDIQSVFTIDANRITTISHGIEVDKFSTPVSLSPELQTRLPERYALYLGNIEPRKNLIALVSAFTTPELRSSGLPLVIAGKPAWNAEESMALIEASPNVHHVGFVSDSDRVALMQQCQLFVFPSLYEGFGFPVLEALAAGAVVLTSNKGSLAEVAGPALTLHDLSADGIADGVLRVLSNGADRASCVEGGLAWASRFSWDESVAKHVDVYRKVLA